MAAAVAQTTQRGRSEERPAWTLGVQDLEREHGLEPLTVRGRLPKDLVGTLYRNGPGRFGAGRHRVHHWFDADGAVTAVKLTGDGALGAVRLVRTEGLEREERAGRRLFGGYGTPFARPIREMLMGDTKNPANTSVLFWQSRLFATCEADAPYEVEPTTLQTVGESRLGRVIVGPFSAHPHYVPLRRTTYNFGLAHGRKTQVDAYALPDEGPARHMTSFDLDGLRVHHDFAVTDRYLVFAFAPMYMSLLGCLFLGRPPVSSARWRPERGTEMVIVPIDEPSRLVRFRTDALLFEHLVNAFEDGDELVVDYTHYDDMHGLEGYVGGVVDGRIQAPLKSELRRMRVDVAKQTAKTEAFLKRPVELPRVSPRAQTKRHRYAYCVEAGADNEPFAALLKHDAESGHVDEYRPGQGRYVGEGVFVPRPGGTAEDDGWLLTMTLDCGPRGAGAAGSGGSALEILDARAIGDGPVASCAMGQALPFGFHGVFVPGA